MSVTPFPRRQPRPEFLTAEEVAKAFRVSKMTIYREIRLGRLRAVRIGRTFRIFQTSVDEYVRDQEVGFDLEIGGES